VSSVSREILYDTLEAEDNCGGKNWIELIIFCAIGRV
jgi:hypothetical protein